MIIYGAGMAGLIAANMLRRFKPTVLEAKGGLPLAHKAVLRFRSDAVARATGIPFKRVQVRKAIKHPAGLINEVTLQLANAYSLKVTGKVLSRSINRLETEDRWIAPEEFPQLLAEQAEIEFGSQLNELEGGAFGTPCISTIPMAVMAKQILKLEKMPEFQWRNITVVRAELDFDCEVYQTIYYPGPEPYYRASLEGRTMIIECIETQPAALDSDDPNQWIWRCAEDFGLTAFGHCGFQRMPEVHLQPFGKIMPVDDSWRRNFIFELTRKKNVYSLGRFATWRQILLDDVVKDVEQIERMIASGDNYTRRLAAE